MLLVEPSDNSAMKTLSHAGQDSSSTDHDSISRQKMIVAGFPGRYVYALIAYSLLAFLVAGFILHRSYEERLANWQGRLTHIGEVNQRLLQSWLKEREKDSQALATLAPVRSAVSGTRGTALVDSLLQSRLDAAARIAGAAIFVVDRDGMVRAKSRNSPPFMHDVSDACKTSPVQKVLTILPLPGVASYPQLAFLYPILEVTRTPSAQDKIAGCAVLLTAPQDIAALQLSDAGVTASGETLFVVLRGDSPVFISPLRNWDRNSQLPLPAAGRPARISLQQRRTTFGVYRDYRRVPVLAVTRFVPSVGWGMVTKVDRAEVFADFRQILVQGICIAALSVMLVVSLLVSLWRHRRNQPFREALLNSGIGVAVTDLAGKFVVVNREFCRITGYGEAELRLLDSSSITHPEDRDKNVDLGDRTLAGALPASLIEKRYITKAGDTVWVRNSTSLVRDRSGKGANVIELAEDIPERKEAELALRERERQFRTLGDSIPQLAWMANPDGWIFWYNRRWYEYTGATPEQMEGWGWQSVHDPAELPKVLARWKTSLATGEPFEMIFPLRGKAGDFRSFLTLVSPMKDESGKIFRWFGTNTDLEEQESRDRALRDSEDRYRDLVESSHDLICTHDLQGHLLSVNPASAKVLGYEVAELLRIPMREIIAPGFREDFDRYLDRIGKHSADQGMMCVLTRSGKQRIWEYHNTLRTEGVPSPIVRGMAHDITERLEVEKRLREQATRLRLLVSSANIGLWDWNLITNQVYFSPEWKRQIGYADDEILNRLEEWQDRVHPDDVERCVQKVSAYIANPQGLHELEFRLRHKDGSYRWMFAQADVLRDAAGKTVRMLGCHIDITERKQGEQALRMQAEQLRALSYRVQTAREEERKQVARDLHDQIGQILTVARMDVEWVSNRLPRDQIQVHARLQTTLDLIRDGIHTLRKICTELRPGVLDDLGLAAAIEWQAQEFAARANIACEVSVPAEDMALEPDHATAIFRIFQEALTNVARHAEATKVRASLAHRDGRLLLVVEDDGKGIRDSDLALAKGSLGLLGMRERAQACSGRLQIWAGPQGGTTVAADIPVHAGELQGSHYVNSNSR